MMFIAAIALGIYTVMFLLILILALDSWRFYIKAKARLAVSEKTLRDLNIQTQRKHNAID